MPLHGIGSLISSRMGALTVFAVRETSNGELAIEGQRPPSPKTLSRDIACLLSSYATPIPPTQEDPEDGHECPFRSLGLITYLRESDTYQLNRRKKDIPFEIVGYAFAIGVARR